MTVLSKSFGLFVPALVFGLIETQVHTLIPIEIEISGSNFALGGNNCGN
jgi:hypothetical protein